MITSDIGAAAQPVVGVQCQDEEDSFTADAAVSDDEHDDNVILPLPSSMGDGGNSFCSTDAPVDSMYPIPSPLPRKPSRGGSDHIYEFDENLPVSQVENIPEAVCKLRSFSPADAPVDSIHPTPPPLLRKPSRGGSDHIYEYDENLPVSQVENIPESDAVCEPHYATFHHGDTMVNSDDLYESIEEGPGQFAGDGPAATIARKKLDDIDLTADDTEVVVSRTESDATDDVENHYATFHHGDSMDMDIDSVGYEIIDYAEVPGQGERDSPASFECMVPAVNASFECMVLAVPLFSGKGQYSILVTSARPPINLRSVDRTRTRQPQSLPAAQRVSSRGVPSFLEAENVKMSRRRASRSSSSASHRSAS